MLKSERVAVLLDFDLVIGNGGTDPLEYTVEDLRKTADYVRDAERLAGVGDA